MLDLSKLAALSVPEKEIEVSILGEKQKVSVKAITDDVLQNLSDIRKIHPNSSEVEMRVEILQKCAGLPEEDARLLIARDGTAAAFIMGAAFDLYDEFEKAREKAREQALKNAAAAGVQHTSN